MTREKGYGSVGVRQLSQAVHNIIATILKMYLTPEEQVFALRKASTRPRVRKFFKIAGLIDLDKYETMIYLAEQINGK